MPTLMTDRCLMIEMRDKRRMFTAKNNLMSLVEFARIFNAKISLVDAQNVEVFGIDELPVAICDGTYNYSGGSYTPLDTVLPREAIFAANRPKKGGRPRSDTLTLAGSIRGFIRQSFQGRQTISLRLLKDKYGCHGLSESCLSGHLNHVKRTMEKEGFQIDRIAKGTYRLGD